MSVNFCLLGIKPLELVLTIPDGFGRRLREERERLGLSQTTLANIAGIQRLAQSQYEKEASSPSVRYLAAAAKSGVNLEYVLFGRTPCDAMLTPQDRYQIEAEAFQELEAFIESQPGGRMGAEGRFALFQAFRARRTQDAIKRIGQTVVD